jgi:hypothetical protein
MTIASNPPIEIPLERMTSAQKWDLFQTLCAELDVPLEGQEEIPSWHMEVLAERRAAFEAGEAEVLDLNEFLRRARERMP